MSNLTTIDEIREKLNEILIDGQRLYLKDTLTNEQLRNYQIDFIVELYRQFIKDGIGPGDELAADWLRKYDGANSNYIKNEIRKRLGVYEQPNNH